MDLTKVLQFSRHEHGFILNFVLIHRVSRFLKNISSVGKEFGPIPGHPAISRNEKVTGNNVIVIANVLVFGESCYALFRPDEASKQTDRTPFPVRGRTTKFHSLLHSVPHTHQLADDLIGHVQRQRRPGSTGR